jgi:3-methyl-2-oxobutanoate hydroxymethyltransferase
MTKDELLLKYKKKDKIIMLTAYDAQTASILEEAGTDIILVGDSLGMVFQGFNSTKNVSIEDMVYHIKAVKRGTHNTFIVGDMPIGTYENPEAAYSNAVRLIEAGADAVKLEGAKIRETGYLVKKNIIVQGHLGLLPQTAASYKVTGKSIEDAAMITEAAEQLQKAGAFSIVLECIPDKLAKSITERLSVPTLGIGAGPDCSGQVLVINDLLGMTKGKKPKFVKPYTNLHDIINNAVKHFIGDVKCSAYPDSEHTYH